MDVAEGYSKRAIYLHTTVAVSSTYIVCLSAVYIYIRMKHLFCTAFDNLPQVFKNNPTDLFF